MLNCCAVLKKTKNKNKYGGSHPPLPHPGSNTSNSQELKGGATTRRRRPLSGVPGVNWGSSACIKGSSMAVVEGGGKNFFFKNPPPFTFAAKIFLTGLGFKVETLLESRIWSGGRRQRRAKPRRAGSILINVLIQRAERPPYREREPSADLRRVQSYNPKLRQHKAAVSGPSGRDRLPTESGARLYPPGAQRDLRAAGLAGAAVSPESRVQSSECRRTRGACLVRLRSLDNTFISSQPQEVTWPVVPKRENQMRFSGEFHNYLRLSSI